MKRFNLLREVENIRNTIAPDTPVPGERGSIWRSPAVWTVVICAAVVSGWLWYIGAEITVNFDRIHEIFGDTQSRRAPADPVARQGVAPAGDFSPTDGGKIPDSKRKEKLGVIVSRPVARDARADPITDEEDVWSIRFSLCVYRDSCESVLEMLKREGIDAYLDEGMAEIEVYRVVLGPWPTASGADEATARLRREGVDFSRFSVEDRFYLSAGPFVDEQTAFGVLKKAKDMGYRGDAPSKTEARKVYKVYEGKFANKSAASKELLNYKKRGIECVLEKH